MQSTFLRIGTRGSPLALAQAEETATRLAAALGEPRDRFVIVPITTSGDRIRDRPLAEAGGKGLFTKEIEEALASGAIDLAVHSAKDMPTLSPPGLVLAACLKREDFRDAFVGLEAKSLADLPSGAVVGTSSLRRRALVLRSRPDLAVTDLRGNVETRLKRVAEGTIDAAILAAAGLNRLGLAGRASSFLDVGSFLPAVAQGAIAIEIRDKDDRVAALVAAVNHAETMIAVTAERAFLAALDGSCRTPIGGLAEISGDTLRFRGIIVTVDGTVAHETERNGGIADAVALGSDAGEELRRRGGPDFFTTG